MTEIALYLATGAVAGLSAGLLGIGGGLIIVPVLVFIFSGHGFAMAHHKRGAVLWPIVINLSPGIVVGAWLGAIFASSLTSEMLRPVFGVFELLVAAHLLINYRPGTHSTSISRTRSVSGGMVIGCISSIVGIGGGTLTVPFLLWHNISIRNAVASSAACGFPIAVAGTAAYVVSGWNAEGLPAYTLGYVSLSAFAVIIITSMFAAPAGASLAHRLPEKALRLVFAIFLLALGARMLLF